MGLKHSELKAVVHVVMIKGVGLCWLDSSIYGLVLCGVIQPYLSKYVNMGGLHVLIPPRGFAKWLFPRFHWCVLSGDNPPSSLEMKGGLGLCCSDSPPKGLLEWLDSRDSFWWSVLSGSIAPISGGAKWRDPRNNRLKHIRVFNEKVWTDEIRP
ncbi:hypothetical protein GOBAR_DD10884 [Gossypium barbadense]|nr:hypothetical protein GOBAR_DD10884 [Gossypium barbadense]